MDYYKPYRSRNIFDPIDQKPFKLSRSKIDQFINCPRCFYIDRRLGTVTPPGYPFNLNSAVDHLLKKEFDYCRARKEPHPLMLKYRIDALPYQHSKLDYWRENFKGVQVHHKETNLILTGAVDDVWISSSDQLIVVDYKATSKDSEVTLDADWQIGYKRQMEFYQWLLRNNGFDVSDTGYFVYCNGDKSKNWFNDKLEFKTKVIPYTGNDEWVEDAILAAHDCLSSDIIPDASDECAYCTYQVAVQHHIGNSSGTNPI
jgi:CRISPR/Cas system-associated exonuclease Cas4 (RecB family)